MNDTDRLIAVAQVWITGLLLSFTFILLLIYELGLARLPPDQLKDFARSLDWLEGASLIAVYFWFQRARTAGIPDPTQVITQTKTSPDGTKTVIQSPIKPKGTTDEKPSTLNPAAGA